jgi:hypothetical protein
MFKVIKDNKIIGISEKEPVLLDEYIVEEDTEHTTSDYEQYQGEYLLKDDIPAPTKEEQEAKRAQAYLVEVDPITAHIQRERDKAEPDQEKITQLLAERDAKVQDIQERFPYPVETEE